MHLHQNADDFRAAIELTGEHFGISGRIIEKDYWVTLALWRLSKWDQNEMLVFKGGTSLTKAFLDLHRFSEDIDLALLSQNLTNSQKKSLISRAEDIMSEGLSEETFEEQRKSGDYRFTQFSYKSLFGGVSTLVEMHPMIRFEISSFMEPEPYEIKTIQSMISEYLISREESDFIAEYGLEAFKLQVLSIDRTLLEKLVSLIRMSYTVDTGELLRKTRHLYDIHCICTAGLTDVFDNVKLFSELKCRVMLGEAQSRFGKDYPYEQSWHEDPLFNGILGSAELSKAYTNDFGREFVFGALPPIEEIQRTFDVIRGKLTRLER